VNLCSDDLRLSDVDFDVSLHPDKKQEAWWCLKMTLKAEDLDGMALARLEVANLIFVNVSALRWEEDRSPAAGELISEAAGSLDASALPADPPGARN